MSRWEITSKFSIVYTNPVANNYTIIQITSTGTSADGTATRVVSQQVEYGSLLFSPPQLPLVSKGSVSISGNAGITNLTNKQYDHGGFRRFIVRQCSHYP